MISYVQVNVVGKGLDQHDIFSTRLVALYFEVLLLLHCRCAANHHPGPMPPAAGLHAQKSTARERLTNASCIPQGLSGHLPKNDGYPVICIYCIQQDAGSRRSVLVHPK